ncbi:hypothetical protein AN958_08277, partial [Leucoagaricus sp. SymC.cos]
SGANVKKLNGQFVTIGSNRCVIWPAKARPGIPLCQRCWRWGHSTNTCKSEAIRCPRCSGPHSERHHWEYASCCKGNPKANPPIPPTIADVDCPHVPICSNCHGKHAANDRKCKYWRHRFDANWFSRRRAEK